MRTGVPWTDYSPLPGWSGKYRVFNYFLEVELQTFARIEPGTDSFNLDQLFPPGFRLGSDAAELVVTDTYREPSIFLGTRLPGYWVRNVSVAVPYFPGLLPCA
jgi:hypothetical protein